MPKTKAKPKKKAPPKKAAKSAKTNAILVGEGVPEFALPITGGGQIGPGDFKGKIIVLYFYPKDSTPGCTLEGKDFTRLHKEFRAAGAEVYGVSRDTLKSHEKFKGKEEYSFELISDEDEDLCKIFGVIKMKNMYGRQVRGIERSTFVIDSKGKLKKEWRGVRVPGHAEDVLSFVRTL